MTSIPIEYAEFPATTSNGIISKTKDFFCNCYCFYQTYIKFRTFWSKNVSLIVSIFPNYWLRRRWLLERPKRLASEHLSAINVFTSSKHCRNQHDITIIHIVPWIWDKLSWKKCRLVRFEILELFVNTLTTDDKYSSRNIQNLTQQLQTTMSQKQKTFYRIFITYVKSRRSSDDFVKKDESTSLSIYDIIDAEKCGYLNV